MHAADKNFYLPRKMWGKEKQAPVKQGNFSHESESVFNAQTQRHSQEFFGPTHCVCWLV